MSGKKEQPTHVDQRWLLDHLRCLWPRRSLLKRGTRNSASPTPPCDQPDARVIETTGGPRQTLSLQTIGPHVGLRGATGVAALAAAALQSSVPMRTVTVQQARSATGLPRSSKRMPSSSRRSCPPSQTASSQLRLSPLRRSLCRWRALRPRRSRRSRCRCCHHFTTSWMRQRGASPGPLQGHGP
jgi:hypothetical protein